MAIVLGHSPWEVEDFFAAALLGLLGAVETAARGVYQRWPMSRVKRSVTREAHLLNARGS